MAALAITHPTLLDLSRRLDENDKIARIIEMLAQRREIHEDAVWIEGNLTTGHKTTVRTGLPAPTWRKLYGGVQPTKSTTAQIVDTCGSMEAYAEVDKKLADLNGNTAAFRLSEDQAHIEGMNQEFEDTLWFGNESTEPEAFTGIRPRFDSTTATNAENLINGGAANGQTDCTSIYLIVWGPNTVHCIYPKGMKAGLQMENKGQVTIENIDGAGGRMEAYRTHYMWDCGLTVRDWRYVVRIHSIDVSTLTKNASAGADLIDLMSDAETRIPSMSMGRAAWYMGRTAHSFLKRQINNKVAGSTLTVEMIGGKPVMMFSGIPVRRADRLTNSETSKN